MQDAKSLNQFADFWAVGPKKKKAQTLILASEHDPSSQRRSNMYDIFSRFHNTYSGANVQIQSEFRYRADMKPVDKTHNSSSHCSPQRVSKTGNVMNVVNQELRMLTKVLHMPSVKRRD